MRGLLSLSPYSPESPCIPKRMLLGCSSYSATQGKLTISP